MEFGIVRLVGIFIVGTFFDGKSLIVKWQIFNSFNILFDNSKCWCRIRHLRSVRGRTNGSARLVRCPLDRRIGRPDDRVASLEEFRTKTSRTTDLVGGARILRGVYAIRHFVQRFQPRSFLPGQLTGPKNTELTNATARWLHPST